MSRQAHNDTILERMRGVAPQRDTLETTADPRNPNVVAQKMAAFYLSEKKWWAMSTADMRAWAKRNLLLDPFGKPYAGHELTPSVRQCCALLGISIK